MDPRLAAIVKKLKVPEDVARKAGETLRQTLEKVPSLGKKKVEDGPLCVSMA